MLTKIIICLAFCLVIAACSGSERIVPPTAGIDPSELEKHGDVRIDNYYWLKERENPEVIAYLEAENEYLEKTMAHTKTLQDLLFDEIRGRIKENDESVPYKLEDYYYYNRFEEGKEYQIYCRKKGSLDGVEEVMVNANGMAKGHDFFSVSGLTVSSGQNLLAFGVDTVGRRFYTIHFKDLESGELLAETIPDVTGNMAWANDNKTLFYTKQDPDTLRSFQVFRHTLGSDPSQDHLVFQEDDEIFGTYVFKTKSKKYLMIACVQTLSTEFHYLDARQPEGEFIVFQPRERNHEYSVDHYKDKFYIRTNLEARNFRLMETPVGKTSKTNWKEVIPNREDVYLSGFEIFKDYLVIQEREEGLTHLRIRSWSGSSETEVAFEEPAYWAYLSTNPEFDTPLLRYGYSSMTTPNSVYDYNMATGEKTLLKRDEVVGDFDPSNYTTERLNATASDGVKVPISIVYRKGFDKNGKNPLLLYGYGSYGMTIDARFSAPYLSLLDRGFAFAIAHIRGSQIRGRHWYEDGKLLKKKNTFTDFIACGEFLIQEGFTDRDRLFAQGGSAGGLLMGAVANMAPHLFKGIVAQVPFVDVITTMLDPDIPLTTGEYDEWGDPNKKEYYDNMLSYSPYDQVEAKAYPAMLVTAGLHDSQVQYWEPAKWVAKLRVLKTDQNLLILHTNMDAGHGGVTGRFKRHKETALIFAFMLNQVGITK